jgi:hypothetical protein
MRDMPELAGGSKVKLASSLAQFAIYSFIFNNLFEMVAGRRPTIDPIQYVLQIAGVEPGGTGGALEDLAGNLPFVGGITGGRLPVGAGLPDVPSLLRGTTTLPRELRKPLFFLAPPMGGLQAKKTLEGMGAFMRGGSYTPSGRRRYKIDPTVANLIRTGLFGQYATPEAREYFNRR